MTTMVSNTNAFGGTFAFFSNYTKPDTKMQKRHQTNAHGQAVQTDKIFIADRYDTI